FWAEVTSRRPNSRIHPRIVSGPAANRRTRWFDSFRPCGFRMLLWRFSSILRYSGRAGSMFVSRRSTAMAGPEDRNVKESFRVDIQLCRREVLGPIGAREKVVQRFTEGKSGRTRILAYDYLFSRSLRAWSDGDMREVSSLVRFRGIGVVVFAFAALALFAIPASAVAVPGSYTVTALVSN